MKKIIALLLTVILIATVLTACGGDNDTDNGGSKNPEPTPTPKVLHIEPFTGEEQSFDYPQGQRPVAVMVNNIMQVGTTQIAWPHYGLSQADVIFEMETEGGITRMMAVFRDYTQMPQVGPVRSARDQFVQMLLPTSAIYVHEGESTYATTMLDYYSYRNADLQAKHGIIFWDNSLTDRATEHRAFTSGQMITDYIAKDNEGEDRILEEGEPLPLFNFVDYDLPDRDLDSVSVSSIGIKYSSAYSGELVYNAETQTYQKFHTESRSGQTKNLIDAGNSNLPVEFDNVFVLWTTVELYQGDYLPNFDLGNGGVGYYFSNGQVEKISWTKGPADFHVKVYDFNGTGEEIEVNPGTSYITVVDLDYYDSFTFNGVPVDVKKDYSNAEVEAEQAAAAAAASSQATEE